ncbi:MULTISPECIES: 30S ribosomal protein S18 [Arcobacteraceae]|jgi:small subunit ribosomal protein S18|uniref:Small ribosomal subunit protein bS18 n=2 Tax=Aliarcobacter skirrowii TaxID=28200 RepID=A0A2U2C1K9_9BACT|nr:MULTISPECIES: 30S ribosomal protein S18 [Arcobacteraceae]AXX85563.1 30S ribosomal protein S18 [Aliarcobacter skirrowii CCUG 10374]AZL54625.1 30S ribosomal protein S18 [Aliarcobacter skirrowii]KAB0621028.1 30S ribosomal protein S18 [Aliarcobacter skirrowii CCUG 10374]MCT7446266.1 30S ribosomal protein S18 [Aliarcobacter skirrowii]MDD2508300.1 30S ribosomal protein S18 [Aliarcobacter skirrowii]
MSEKRKYGKKSCKYTEMKVDFIDYKNIELLKISMSERGKIMPRRLTGNSKNAQEMVEKAIKRARHMALVPYVVDTQNLTDTAYSKSFL